jgi:dipeptidyl aminopeptidase/acylaminoacyl peptidase
MTNRILAIVTFCLATATSRILAIVTFCLATATSAGCRPGPSQGQVGHPTGPVKARVKPATFPELGPSQLIQPGIRFQEATLRRGSIPMRVWYYEPDQAAHKLALVIVPPAGSTLFEGMALAEGDRREHFPYVKAGFAVVSFDIDGSVPNRKTATQADLLQGAQQFRDAQAGLANTQAALDFVLAKVPHINPDRIYIAGHSSAGTLALLAAEYEPRIKACAAYAACTDVEERLAKSTPVLDSAIPGYREFLRFSSPKTAPERLKCPAFLFHAEDDATVPVRHSTDFAALLQKTNPQVTLVTSAKGGHYNPMIREGIPKAIEWLGRIQSETR